MNNIALSFKRILTGLVLGAVFLAPVQALAAPTISYNMPDLALRNARFMPAYPLSSLVKIQNKGTKDANPDKKSALIMKYEVTNVGATESYFTAYREVSDSLAAGDGFVNGFNLAKYAEMLPLTEGESYELHMTIDPSGDVLDLDSSNNSAYATFVLLRPDLGVEGVAATVSDSDVTVDYTLFNNSETSIPATVLDTTGSLAGKQSIYLDGVLVEEEMWADASSTAYLMAEGSSTLSHSLTDVAEGEHSLEVCIDEVHVIGADNNYDNNCSSTLFTVVPAETVPEGINLTATDAFFHSDYPSEFLYHLSNTGTTDVDAETVVYAHFYLSGTDGTTYLSEDRKLSAADLKAGAMRTSGFNLLNYDLSALTAGTTYTVTVVVDSYDVVDETAEDDNTSSARFVFYPTDLGVDGLAVTNIVSEVGVTLVQFSYSLFNDSSVGVMSNTGDSMGKNTFYLNDVELSSDFWVEHTDSSDYLTAGGRVDFTTTEYAIKTSGVHVFKVCIDPEHFVGNDSDWSNTCSSVEFAVNVVPAE